MDKETAAKKLRNMFMHHQPVEQKEDQRYYQLLGYFDRMRKNFSI
jgi:hypothetical protein